MADKNHTSINSTPAGGVLVNGIEVLGPNVPIEERIIDFGDLVPVGEYSDTLKFSRVSNLVVNVDRIVGSKEDCIDVNNLCQNITVNVNKLEPKGKFAATIKGGSENINLVINRLYGHGTEMDFDFGNRSEQSTLRTKNCSVFVGKAEGKVNVRVLHAWKPKLTGPVQYKLNTWMRGWIAKLFRFFPYFTK